MRAEPGGDPEEAAGCTQVVREAWPNELQEHEGPWVMNTVSEVDKDRSQRHSP